MSLKNVIKGTVAIASLAGIGFAGYKAVEKRNDLKKNFKDVSWFKGKSIVYDQEEFTGDELAVMFSGLEIDFRGVIINEPAVLKVHGEFSGIRIVVPDTMLVKATGTSVNSGVSNHLKWDDDTEAAPLLTIEYEVKYAGLEIIRASEVDDCCCEEDDCCCEDDACCYEGEAEEDEAVSAEKSPESDLEEIEDEENIDDLEKLE